jgi:hypothetical protein
VIVNIFLPPDGVEPGAPVGLNALRHDGIGTLYATREEAEATFAELADGQDGPRLRRQAARMVPVEATGSGRLRPSFAISSE